MFNTKKPRKSRQGETWDKQKKSAASTLKGFTLLEILFVTLIIGIIAATVVVSMGKTAKEKSRIAASQKFADSVRAQLSGYPISWWKFDEGGGVTAGDSWGGNSGTINGGVTWPKGVTGKALEFDGSNGNYVDVGNDASLDITTAITVEAWVKPVINGNYRRIVSKQYSGTSTGASCFQLGINNSDEWRWSIGGVFDASPASPKPEEGKWYHFVGTYDSNSSFAGMYVNGEEIWSSSSYSAPIRSNLSQPVTIGISKYGGVAYAFEGSIDEVRIYGEALVAQEIQRRYVENAPKYGLVLK